MELYIEREFIDEFYLKVDIDNTTRSEKALISILKNYGDVNVFIDASYNTMQEFNQLQLSNPFIGCLLMPPVSVVSIKEHFFNFSKCKQTILLLSKPEMWIKEAEDKGALCLSLENFERRILELIEYAESLDIDIDEFENWGMFSFMEKFPFNNMTICDNYLLTNKKAKPMQKNIIPMLKVMLKGKEKQTIPVNILTKEFNADQPGTPKQVVEAVQHKLSILNRGLANYGSKFKILNTKESRNMDIHGRELITNFIIIRSGEGFNLIPPHNSSNEVITSGTIFNKRDYIRINKRIKMYSEFESKLNKLETLNFTSYPG